MLLVAGLLLGLLAMRDAGSTASLTSIGLPAFGVRESAAAPGVAASSTLSPGTSPETPHSPMLAQAIDTANVYAHPDRTSQRIAVFPAGQRAVLAGRTADGAWLLVSYPAGSTTRGWVRTASLDAPRAAVEMLAALPAAMLAAAAPTPVRAAPVTALPDLAIVELGLLEGDRLAVGIRNLGETATGESTMTLHVMSLEGELIGVLTIGQTSLAPGASATVVTALAIPRPGSYRVEIDPANEIAEAQKGNNTRQALLVPAKG